MTVTLVKADCLTEADWGAMEVLFDRCRQQLHPMQHPVFARYLGDVRPDVAILFMEDDSGLAGFWPVHCRPGRWLRAIGGPFADYHGPVTKPGVSRDLNQLLSDVNCRGMTVTALAAQPGSRIDAATPHEVYLTRLDEGVATLLAEKSEAFPRFFKKHRRLERKLRKESATVDFVFDDRDEDSLSRLLALKSRQLRASGRHDVLATRWARQFIGKLREGTPERLYARLSSLYIDDELAAAELNLQSGGYLHGWLAGYDQRFFNYSPGHLLVRLILENMAESGMTIYDAGMGHHHYKKYFANDAIEVWSGTLRVPESGLGLAAWSSRVWRSAERLSPGRVKTALGKVRRRSDQILASELSVAGRLKGFARAAIGPRT